MKAEELKRLIEQQGYEVKAIRVFKESFHVNFWHPNYKARAFYKATLNSLEWDDLKKDFPKVVGEETK